MIIVNDMSQMGLAACPLVIAGNATAHNGMAPTGLLADAPVLEHRRVEDQNRPNVLLRTLHSQGTILYEWSLTLVSDSDHYNITSREANGATPGLTEE